MHRRSLTTRIGGNDLSVGVHRLTATVTGLRGKRIRLTLRFRVVQCIPAALLVGMGSKLARTRTDLLLSVQSGGPALRSVTFKLPRALRWQVRPKLAGKRIGSVRFGTRTLPLRLARGSTASPRKRVSVLLKRQGSSVVLRLGKHPQIEVRNLPAAVDSLRVRLLGKQTNLIRNAKSFRKLPYAATLVGEQDDRVTLQKRVPMRRR